MHFTDGGRDPLVYQLTDVDLGALDRSAGWYSAATSEIVEYVFRTMFGLDVAGQQACTWHCADSIHAVVNFGGSWNGALRLSSCIRQAREFARLFIGTENTYPPDEECMDVMGELANIVAGNLKRVLARGVATGLPAVFRGPESLPSDRRAGTIVETFFRYEAGGLFVVLAAKPNPLAAESSGTEPTQEIQS